MIGGNSSLNTNLLDAENIACENEAGLAAAAEEETGEPNVEEKLRTLTRTKSGRRRQVVHFKGKLVLVGDIGVGKSALLERYQENRFAKERRPTVGVDFGQISVAVNGSVVQFDVWDSAGEERFRSINSLYYHGCGAAVAVFDIINRSSFESVKRYWIPHVRENGAEGIIIVLVGNKCDLHSVRNVAYEEAMELAKAEGILYYETSAKTGFGVRQALCSIAKKVPENVLSRVSVSEEGDLESQNLAHGFRITKVESSLFAPPSLDDQVHSSRFCCW